MTEGESLLRVRNSRKDRIREGGKWNISAPAKMQKEMNTLNMESYDLIMEGRKPVATPAAALEARPAILGGILEI